MKLSVQRRLRAPGILAVVSAVVVGRDLVNAQPLSRVHESRINLRYVA